MSLSVRKVRTSVILFNAENELLLLRQNDKPFWVLPGGTLEPNETLLDCAIRELKEETNLDIVIEQLIDAQDYLSEKQPQTVDIYYLGKLRGGELQLASDENLNEARFITKAEFALWPFQPEGFKSKLLSLWPPLV